MSLQVWVSGGYGLVYGVCLGQDDLGGDLLHLAAGLEEPELAAERSADQQVQVREHAGLRLLLQLFEGLVHAELLQRAGLQPRDQRSRSLVELFGADWSAGPTQVRELRLPGQDAGVFGVQGCEFEQEADCEEGFFWSAGSTLLKVEVEERREGHAREARVLRPRLRKQLGRLGQRQRVQRLLPV